jgi:hypothetical protein
MGCCRWCKAAFVATGKRVAFCAPACYQAWRKSTRLSFTERFWSKVDKNGPTLRVELGPCWIWKGHTAENGYGRFAWRDADLRVQSRPAHVVAWEQSNGRELPDGMYGCHRCDNPPCCNPDHVFPGTSQENRLDCIAKGRHSRDNSAGTSASARAQKSRAHCKNGHPFSGHNLYFDRRSGARRCRACAKAGSQRYLSRLAMERVS